MLAPHHVAVRTQLHDFVTELTALEKQIAGGDHEAAARLRYREYQMAGFIAEHVSPLADFAGDFAISAVVGHNHADARERCQARIARLNALIEQLG